MADIEVDLDDETIDALVELGLAKRVLELTPAGNAWLSDYCKQRRAEAKKIIPCAGGDGHGL